MFGKNYHQLSGRRTWSVGWFIGKTARLGPRNEKYPCGFGGCSAVLLLSRVQMNVSAVDHRMGVERCMCFQQSRSIAFINLIPIAERNPFYARLG